MKRDFGHIDKMLKQGKNDKKDCLSCLCYPFRSCHDRDLVVMDNLRYHRVQGVKEAIEKIGAQVLYLPPCSPDYNPIEMMWSKIKAILRKVKARSVDSLLIAIPQAFHAISIPDILGWFHESGYSLS